MTTHDNLRRVSHPRTLCDIRLTRKKQQYFKGKIKEFIFGADYKFLSVDKSHKICVFPSLWFMIKNLKSFRIIFNFISFSMLITFMYVQIIIMLWWKRFKIKNILRKTFFYTTLINWIFVPPWTFSHNTNFLIELNFSSIIILLRLTFYFKKKFLIAPLTLSHKM